MKERNLLKKVQTGSGEGLGNHVKAYSRDSEGKDLLKKVKTVFGQGLGNYVKRYSRDLE